MKIKTNSYLFSPRWSTTDADIKVPSVKNILRASSSSLFKVSRKQNKLKYQ